MSWSATDTTLYGGIATVLIIKTQSVTPITGVMMTKSKATLQLKMQLKRQRTEQRSENQIEEFAKKMELQQISPLNSSQDHGGQACEDPKTKQREQKNRNRTEKPTIETGFGKNGQILTTKKAIKLL